MGRRLCARWATLLAASLLGLIVAVLGVTDIPVQAARSVLRRHDLARPHVLLVDIDDKTIARLGDWPIARHYYADLIDRVFAAGAARILFDLNFSSRQNAQADAAFGAAIRAHPGRVTLLTQQIPPDGGPGAKVLPPIPELAQGAALAGAWVPYARGDGTVLRAPYAVRWGGVVYPDVVAAIAGVTGAPGTSFPIDTAIAVKSLPRIAMADALGGLPKELAAGRIVVVGIAEDRIGPDTVALPGQGRVTSATMLAIGAETLLQGPPREISPYLILTVAIGIAALAVASGGGVPMLGAGIVVLLGVQIALPVSVFTNVAPGLIVLLATLAIEGVARRYSPPVQI